MSYLQNITGSTQNSKLHPNYCHFVNCFMCFVGHMPLIFRDSLKHKEATSKVKLLLLTAITVYNSHGFT